jgi:hypothetical protein
MPPSELMAFNAVLEPMLIHASRQVTQKATPTARRGIFHPGVTFEHGVSQSLTRVRKSRIVPERESQRKADRDHERMTKSVWTQ